MYVTGARARRRRVQLECRAQQLTRENGVMNGLSKPAAVNKHRRGWEPIRYFDRLGIIADVYVPVTWAHT